MKTKILFPLAGLALFCACKGSYSSSQSADSDGVVSEKEKTVNPNTGSAEKEKGVPSTLVVPKMVKTASMRFEVKDVKQTSENIASLTQNNNGMVVYHTINTVVSDSTTIPKSDDSLVKVTVQNSAAEMTVKIPAAKVEGFVDEVAKLGATLNSLKFEANDKTFDYLATRLKLNNQQQRVESSQTGSANLQDADNLLAFKNKMTDQQINNLKTDDSVKNAVITLIFYEKNAVHKETMANPDMSVYRAPVSNRFGMAFKNGWVKFTDVMVALANFWAALPVAGLIWLVVYVVNKKKKDMETAKS